MVLTASFAAEAWTWYFFAFSATVLRLASRAWTAKRNARNGSASITRKTLQLDDWIMVVTFLCYTTDLICAEIVVSTLPTLSGGPAAANDQPAPSTPATSSSVNSSATRRSHAEVTMVVEQLQIATIWLVKACLLTVHHKLTRDLGWQHLAVKIIAVYVALGFVVMEILYFGVWCRPFKNYFPDSGEQPSAQCTKHTNHFILNAVLNISSDIAILCVMLPLFARTKLQLREKLMLCGVFGLGGLVILWAALSKAYTFTHRFDIEWLLFYVRESSTAVIVANMPVVLPMVRKWARSSKNSQSASTALSGKPMRATDTYGAPTLSTASATSPWTMSLSCENDDIASALDMTSLPSDGGRAKTMSIETARDIADAEAAFCDRTKLPDYENFYESMKQTQKAFIAPWGEPP